MIIRIDDAIALHNARQEKKNKENGKPLNYGKLTKANLGRIMFPSNTPKSPLKKMTHLTNGDAKFIKPEWVDQICEYTGTDANFLFGMKSKHDRDYNKFFN